MNIRPQCRARVRFSDCDPFGHLYNVRYFDYLFDAREEHVAAEYPLLREEMRSRERNWVTVSTDIRYAAPALWGETVTLESRVLEVTRNSALVEMAMSGAQELKAILWTRLRYVDLARRAVTNHSPEVQRFLQTIVSPAAARSLDERLSKRRAEIAEVQT